MDIEQYKVGAKKRREERLHLLRKKQRAAETSSVRQSDDSFQRYYGLFQAEEPEERIDHKGVLPLLFKILCALLFVGGGYIVMSSENANLAATQELINEVLHRDFNVVGVMNWVEEYTGGEVQFFPQIIQRPTPKKEPSDYGVPVSAGKVISNFGETQHGIMVRTSASLPVEVIKEGWVTFIGEKEGLGFTIIIEHGNGEESWYAQIGDARVEQYDWVHQGDVIGYTRIDEEKQGVFYFALRKDSQFINPLDVISFD